MAAKTSWHRYVTKFCHAMNMVDVWFARYSVCTAPEVVRIVAIGNTRRNFMKIGHEISEISSRTGTLTHANRLHYYCTGCAVTAASVFYLDSLQKGR